VLDGSVFFMTEDKKIFFLGNIFIEKGTLV